MAEPRAKAPKKASGKSRKREPRKIEYVEGEEAFQNFVDLAKQLILVPKSQIAELERKGKRGKG